MLTPSSAVAASTILWWWFSRRLSRSRSTSLSSTTNTVDIMGPSLREFDDSPVVIEHLDQPHETGPHVALHDVAGDVGVVGRHAVLVALRRREHEHDAVAQRGVGP